MCVCVCVCVCVWCVCVCKNSIWHSTTNNVWYVIKPNQFRPSSGKFITVFFQQIVIKMLMHCKRCTNPTMLFIHALNEGYRLKISKPYQKKKIKETRQLFWIFQNSPSWYQCTWSNDAQVLQSHHGIWWHPGPLKASQSTWAHHCFQNGNHVRGFWVYRIGISQIEPNLVSTVFCLFRVVYHYYVFRLKNKSRSHHLANSCCLLEILQGWKTKVFPLSA